MKIPTEEFDAEVHALLVAWIYAVVTAGIVQAAAVQALQQGGLRLLHPGGTLAVVAGCFDGAYLILWPSKHVVFRVFSWGMWLAWMLSGLYSLHLQ